MWERPAGWSRRGLRRGAAAGRPTPASAEPLQMAFLPSPLLVSHPQTLLSFRCPVRCGPLPTLRTVSSFPLCPVARASRAGRSCGLLCPCCLTRALRGRTTLHSSRYHESQHSSMNAAGGESSRPSRVSVFPPNHVPTALYHLPGSGGWGGASTHSHPPGRTSGKGQPQGLLGNWKQNWGQSVRKE